jgi:hypothetical protein
MTDTPASAIFTLPSGLTDDLIGIRTALQDDLPIFELDWERCLTEAIAVIASIPDMVAKLKEQDAEIERLASKMSPGHIWQVNKNAELLGDNDRLRAINAELCEALEEIAMMVSYIIIHGVGTLAPDGDGPQIVPVSPEELKALIVKIGGTARAALAKAKPTPQPKET